MGRGENGRRRVLDAAAKVFETEGFQTATMSRVAEAAGVSKGLPYYHFDGKVALARAVIARHLDAIVETLEDWPEGPPEARLRWFLETALHHARANASSYRLYLSLALQPATRALVLEEVGERREALAALDEELRAILRAYGHDEAETEAVMLRATVDGLIQYLLLQPERFPIDEAADRLLSLYGEPPGTPG